MNPAENPRLYQLIAHLTEVLHVPMPKRVYLDCEMNASAGFRRGWLSALGNDLEVTIGLPLAAGVTTQQLATVIAHELGHCTQGFAMRVSYVIGSVNGWFYRVVYQRDEWDKAIESWQDSQQDYRMALIAFLVGMAVVVSRLVLTALMYIGAALSSFLARQMEYHADRCAMEVTGSAGVESLLIRLREQGVVQSIAFKRIDEIWKKSKKLPDCLPEYLNQLERRLPVDFHENAQMTLLNEAASIFATHPTANQRIMKARQLSVPRIFHIQKPAQGLFNDFTRTARAVTAAHYRQNLRLPVMDQMLKPTSEFFTENGTASA